VFGEGKFLKLKRFHSSYKGKLTFDFWEDSKKFYLGKLKHSFWVGKFLRLKEDFLAIA